MAASPYDLPRFLLFPLVGRSKDPPAGTGHSPGSHGCCSARPYAVAAGPCCQRPNRRGAAPRNRGNIRRWGMPPAEMIPSLHSTGLRPGREKVSFQRLLQFLAHHLRIGFTPGFFHHLPEQEVLHRQLASPGSWPLRPDSPPKLRQPPRRSDPCPRPAPGRRLPRSPLQIFRPRTSPPAPPCRWTG